MTSQYSELGDAARLWAIRIRDQSFDDWESFTAWLEADPAHLAAYEAALEDAAWAEEALALAPPAADEPQPLAELPENVVPLRPRRRWLALGGAVAAAVAGVASWSMLSANAAYDVITAPGERQAIALDDGSRVILNGGTRVTIDPDRPREIRLAHGEALFDVRHDDSHPFVVFTQDTKLVDAGTVFNVISDGGALDVAVSHGAVIYKPGRDEIRLTAGDALSRPGADATPVLRRESPQAIGGWQAGQLQYGNASLAEVARDLGRNLGLTIRPAGGAERMRFSGTLMVDGAGNDVLARTGPLLGVSFTAKDGAWIMTPTNGAPSN